MIIYDVSYTHVNNIVPQVLEMPVACPVEAHLTCRLSESCFARFTFLWSFTSCFFFFFFNHFWC